MALDIFWARPPESYPGTPNGDLSKTHFVRDFLPNSIGNSSTSTTCNAIYSRGTILELQITMQIHQQLIHQHHLQPHLQCGNDPTVANHNGIPVRLPSPESLLLSVVVSASVACSAAAAPAEVWLMLPWFANHITMSRLGRLRMPFSKNRWGRP